MRLTTSKEKNKNVNDQFQKSIDFHLSNRFTSKVSIVNQTIDSQVSIYKQSIDIGVVNFTTN